MCSFLSAAIGYHLFMHPCKVTDRSTLIAKRSAGEGSWHCFKRESVVYIFIFYIFFSDFYFASVLNTMQYKIDTPDGSHIFVN